MLLSKHQEKVPACRSYIWRPTQQSSLVQAKWCGAKMLRVEEMEVKDKGKPVQEHYPCERARPFLREANHGISLQLLKFPS